MERTDTDKTINIKGQLWPLSEPVVMGILNVTPDSFYAGSRKQTEREIGARLEEILEQGGRIVDIGGYSSRPDAADVPEEEEMARLLPALKLCRDRFPDVPVSVDTFRSGVARRCVEEFGAALVNDISGGALDAKMFETVAALGVPYVLMHMRGTPRTMDCATDYDDLIGEMCLYFSEKVRLLHEAGVCDILLDPGFGFSKTLDQNYLLMNRLSDFSVFGLPLLVGVSRKRMVHRLLACTAAESLNGTTVLHTAALLAGADLLRVHDVRAAVEAVRIVTKLKNTK